MASLLSKRALKIVELKLCRFARVAVVPMLLLYEHDKKTGMTHQKEKDRTERRKKKIRKEIVHAFGHLKPEGIAMSHKVTNRTLYK